MRKVIAGTNLALDGFCDHTAIIPDEEIHQHYADLIGDIDTILYGRTTFQLMEYWRGVVENPTGNKGIDEFAVKMDQVQKIVFSHSLKNIEWETARLASQSIEQEVLELKKQAGKDILIGSRSLIIQLMKLNLIDEYQLCIHPIVTGNGSPLFESITDRTVFQLIKTKAFSGGAVTLYYQPTNEK